jgi:hypothetical protein
VTTARMASLALEARVAMRSRSAPAGRSGLGGVPSRECGRAAADPSHPLETGIKCGPLGGGDLLRRVCLPHVHVLEMILPAVSYHLVGCTGGVVNWVRPPYGGRLACLLVREGSSLCCPMPIIQAECGTRKLDILRVQKASLMFLRKVPAS